MSNYEEITAKILEAIPATEHVMEKNIALDGISQSDLDASLSSLRDVGYIQWPPTYNDRFYRTIAGTTWLTNYHHRCQVEQTNDQLTRLTLAILYWTVLGAVAALTSVTLAVLFWWLRA